MLRLAHVRDTQDPEERARVRVEYVGQVGTDLSDWMPVVTPFAGDGAGLQLMPEPEDMVVIGFLNGDRDSPVMLGALWPGTQAPPARETTERRLVSRNGHSLTLSDGKADGIVLEDAHGNRLVMSKDGIQIESKGALTLTVSKDTVFETSGEATIMASTLKLNP